MTEKELLKCLEWSGERDQVATCPICGEQCPSKDFALLPFGGHLPRCELGKHLHPEAVVGSWQWAKAQGEAGKKVRRKSWLNRRFFLKRRAWGWDGYDGHDVPCGNSRYEDGPTDGDDWQLYVPPEPETVRWAVKDGWLERGERGSTYAAIDAIYGRVLGGYRLDHFVGHTADGREVKMGTLLKVWLSDDGRVGFYQGLQFYQPVWATHAVMERVAQ